MQNRESNVTVWLIVFKSRRVVDLNELWHCVWCVNSKICNGTKLGPLILLECQECQEAYHPLCHQPPVIDVDVYDPRIVWRCKRCVTKLHRLLLWRLKLWKRDAWGKFDEIAIQSKRTQTFRNWEYLRKGTVICLGWTVRFEKDKYWLQSFS